MRVAFLSEADTPGPFRNQPQDAVVNSSEAIAAVCGMSLWYGWEADEAALNTFADNYDVLLMNAKWCMWPGLAALAGRLRGRCRLWGYQEGPANLPIRLEARRLQWYRGASDHLERFICYDREALPWFAALLRIPAHYLPLPAALAAYAGAAVPWAEREAAPARVAICQTLDEQRGTLLSVQIAGRLRGPGRAPVEAVAHGRTTREVGVMAREIARAGAIPDLDGWLPWKAGPSWKQPRAAPDHASAPPTFLSRIAGCRVAVNLDPDPCYGRFVVDCAGLGIPCVGSRQIAMQRVLFPDLACDGYRDFDRAVRLAQALLNDPKRAQRSAARALARLRRSFSAASVRRRWRRICEEAGA